MPWREVDHTADWALAVEAPTLAELFVEAARGMYALAGYAQPKGVEPNTLKPQTLTLTALDAEALLVAWLQELLYFTETQGVVFGAYTFTAFSPTALTAEVQGYKVPRLEKVIKAVTYHNLVIRPMPGGYTTTLVFDV